MAIVLDAGLARATPSCSALFSATTQKDDSDFLYQGLYADDIFREAFPHDSRRVVRAMIETTMKAFKAVELGYRGKRFAWSRADVDALSDDYSKLLEFEPAAWTRLRERSTGPIESARDAPVSVEEIRMETLVRRVRFADGRTEYFRAASTAARRALFASEIAEALGSASFPRSRLGYFKGEFGVWSEEAPGPLLADYRGRIGNESLFDLLAISYLVHLDDTHDGNFSVGPGREIRAFDFGRMLDLQFDRQFLEFARERSEPTEAVSQRGLIGKTLPPTYRREFIDRVRQLTPALIEQKWSGLLSPHEIQSLLFAREVLLADAAKTR